MGKKKKKYPSQEKYDEENTTVSVRVTKEFRERLRAVQGRRNQSIASMLLEWLETMDPTMRNEEKVLRKVYQQAYLKGFNDAKNQYGIPFHCIECGEIGYIEKLKDKKYLSVAIDGFEEYTHVICPPKYMPSKGKPK